MSTKEDPDAFPLQRDGETQREMLERQIRWLTKQAVGPDGTGFWQMQLAQRKAMLAELNDGDS